MNVIVSVIMPAYNVEKYVSEAIESILDGTYQDFEFLIFNDGSTDKTADVIKSYKDERIRFFNYEQNFGYVKHLNDGIKLAKGKYIARMDADDISDRERLQKQVAFMDANPAIGVCGSWYNIIDSRANVVTVPSDHETLIINLLFNSVFGHPVVIMRAKVLKDNNKVYDNEFMPAEDFKLWVELSRISKLANLSEVLLHYRHHDGQISNHKRQLQLDRIQSVRELQIEYLVGAKLNNEERQMVAFLFGMPEQMYEADFFGKLLEWAAILIQSNKEKKIYIQSLFEAVIINRIKSSNHRMQYSRALLFKKNKSLLLNHISKKDRFKFYLKCLLNWKPGRKTIFSSE